MPTSHQAVDPWIFPAWTGSTSAERVAVDSRRDSAKARDRFAPFNSRGQKVPIFDAPRPRKESKTIGFSGVLWVLSVAGDRKYPRRRHLQAQGVRWKQSPSHGFAVTAPFRQGGLEGRGCGLPRALRALAMTRVFARSADALLMVRWVGNRKGRPSGKYG